MRHVRATFGTRWKMGQRPICALVLALNALGAHASDTQPNREAAVVRFGPTTGLVVESEGAQIDLHGYAWARAQSLTRVSDETDVDFSIPVGRLFTNGHLLDHRLGFFGQVEFAGSSTRLLDLFAEWRFTEAARLRIGQFRTPYSRAFITPLTNLELPSRGLVIDRFGLGRDTGLMLSGDLRSKRFHYDLAIVNGATVNDRNGNRDSPSAIARTEFRFGEVVPYDQAPSLSRQNPLGATIGLGGAFSWRAVKTAAGTTSHEQLGNLAADVAVMWGPTSLRAEGFWRSAHGSPRVANAFGAYGQAGIFVVPRTLEVGGRAGWLSDGPDQQSYEAFLTAYARSGSTSFGHHLKLTLAYRFDTAGPQGIDRRDRHAALVQTQIFF